MDAVIFAIDAPLTDDEKRELLADFGAFGDIELRDGTRIPFATPPSTAPAAQRSGQPLQLGFDIGTMLLVTVASGGALFLKKLSEEAARDAWIGIKKLLGRLARRRKGHPKESLQLQFVMPVGEHVEAHIVLTCTKTRFLDDETWVAVTRRWSNELLRHLVAVKERPAADVPRRVVLHAVVSGGTPPVWHVDNR